jgi:hypothetical protein
VPRLDDPEALPEDHAEGGAADDVEGEVGAAYLALQRLDRL